MRSGKVRFLLGAVGTAPAAGKWVWMTPGDGTATTPQPAWATNSNPQLAAYQFPASALSQPAGAPAIPTAPYTTGCYIVGYMPANGGSVESSFTSPSILAKYGNALGLPETPGGSPPPSPKPPLQPSPGNGVWMCQQNQGSSEEYWLGSGQTALSNSVTYQSVWQVSGPDYDPYTAGFRYAYSGAMQLWSPGSAWPSSTLPGPPPTPVAPYQPNPPPTPAGDAWYNYKGGPVFLPGQLAAIAPFPATQQTASPPANFATSGFNFVDQATVGTVLASWKPGDSWPGGLDWPGGGSPPTPSSGGGNTPNPHGIPSWAYWAGGAAVFAIGGFIVSGHAENSRLDVIANK